MPRETFQSPQEKSSAARAIRTHLGHQLRATYKPELEKPLPQRLADLLRRLTERDKAICL
jgi:hypothetical protein